MQGAWRFVQRLWRLVGEAAEVAAPPARRGRRRSASPRWRCARPPTARSPRCPRTSRGCASTSASPTSTSSPTPSRRRSPRRAAERHRPRLRLGGARGGRNPGATVPPDDAASGRGMLGGARPPHPGRRAGLAGGRTAPCWSRNDHAAGPGQRQEAGGRDSCARRRQRRRSKLPCWRSRRCSARSTAKRPKKVIVVPQRIVNVVA